LWSGLPIHLLDCGWRCVHRHFYVTQLSHQFYARVRQQYGDLPDEHLDRISVEQVRSAVNVHLDSANLAASVRRERFEKEQQDYQRRNRQARASHTKTRLTRLAVIDIDKIKACHPGRADP